MTLEIILFISIVAFITSVVSLGAFSYALQSHKQRILDMYSRLNYLETGMAYHGLTPLPWESEELDNYLADTKDFKREGNVVYLTED